MSARDGRLAKPKRTIELPHDLIDWLADHRRQQVAERLADASPRSARRTASRRSLRTSCATRARRSCPTAASPSDASPTSSATPRPGWSNRPTATASAPSSTSSPATTGWQTRRSAVVELTTRRARYPVRRNLLLVSDRNDADAPPRPHTRSGMGRFASVPAAPAGRHRRHACANQRSRERSVRRSARTRPR